MLKSQSFAAGYEKTRVNWLEINSDFAKAKGEDYYVGQHQIRGLQNWITPIDFKYLSEYAEKYYQVELKLDKSMDPEIIVGARLPSFLIGVEGLSGYEPGLTGRWSDGDSLRILFRDTLPAKFTLVLGINDVFGPNNDQTVDLEVGEWSGSIPGKVNSNIEVNIDNAIPTNTILVKIPNPTSPLSLGGTDSRRLGIRLEKIGIQVNQSKSE
jgi:hypothetical protein